MAALAWNDAIQSLFKEGGALHVLAKAGVWIYPVFVTALAVIITVLLGRASSKVKTRWDDKNKGK